MSKCCGNCKYFSFEDCRGNGICAKGEILLPHCTHLDCEEWEEREESEGE